jgi:hypothetical protein
VEPIDGEEYIIRRIPPASFKNGEAIRPSIKGRHFKLRTGEEGVSANVSSKMSESSLLSLPGALDGSAVAIAKVSDIRAAGFEVVDSPVEDSPGHCEILSNVSSLDDPEARDKLARLFRFVAT